MDNILELKHWSHKDEYIGEYIINVNRSDFGEYDDLEHYKDLVFLINKDETFTFSFDLPFLTKKTGKWRMAGDDVSYQCEILYGSKYSFDRIHRSVNNSMFIEYPRGKKGLAKAKLLYFEKRR